jgi:hypothetical protein
MAIISVNIVTSKCLCWFIFYPIHLNKEFTEEWRNARILQIQFRTNFFDPFRDLVYPF